MAELYFKVGSDWREVVRLREEIEKLEKQLLKMDGSKAPAAVAALEMQLGSAKQKMDEMVDAAALAAHTLNNDFKKKIYDASQAINDFSQKIIDQRNVIKDIEQDMRNLSAQYRKYQGTPRGDMALADYNAAKRVLQEEKNALFALTQQQAEARLSVKRLRDEYALYKDDAKDVIDSNGGIGISLKKAFAVLGGAAVVKSLISSIVKVRGEFQLMDTSIQTLLGSKEKADKLIAEVKEYAKISPLEVKDVSAATQMMLGFNIEVEKVPGFLRAIGDVSMGEKQRFNSLTLAFSQMSAAGKLMGQDLNQMINAGFNPLSFMAEKTGKSIAQLKDEMSKGAISAEMVQQAFVDATSAGGKFYNMSENASKTINGQLSMMQDALDSVYDEIGTKGEGVIIGAIRTTTALIENYETVGKVLTGLVATYGVYRTAVFFATQAENGHSLAMVAARARILATQKAQALLNATMLKNPYVLLVVALGTLVTTMWALSESTNATEKAQKSLNKTLEDAKQRKENLISRTNELINIIRDETQTVYAQIKAWKELQKEMPRAFKSMTLEEFKKLTPEEIQVKINVVTDTMEIDAINEKVEETKRKIEKTKKAIDDAGTATDKIYAKDKLYNINKELEVYLAKQREINKLQKEAAFSALSEKDKIAYYQSQIDKLEQQKTAVQGILDKFIGVSDEVKSMNKEYLDAQAHLNRLNKLVGGFVDKMKGIGSKNAVVKNKSYWEKIKKDAESARDALDVSKKDSEEWNKYTEKIKNAQKELDKYSTPSKQEDQAEKLRKEQEKYKVLIDKQTLERIRTEEDLQMQVDQSRIDSMNEGADKYLAQQELNFEKELQAIDRQKEDLLRKRIDDARSAFDADPKNKGKTFDASGISLMDSEAKAFDSMYKAVIEKTENEKLKAQMESMRNYLKEYGTFQQRKLAIAEEYAEKIKKAEALGNAAEVNRLKRQQQSDVSALEISTLKAEIDWQVVFGEFGSMFNDAIKDTLKKAEEYIKTDKFKEADHSSQKELIDAINQMKNSIGGSGTLNFKKLGQDIQVYQNALNDLNSAKDKEIDSINKLKKAQEEYERALKNGTEAEKEAAKGASDAAQRNANTASENVKAQTAILNNAQQNVTNTAKNLDVTMKNVTEGLSKLASGGLKNAYDGLIQAGKGMSGAIEKVADSLRDVPIIGWILSIIDVLKDGLSDLVGSLLDAIFNAVSGIISDVLSGDLFVTIFKSIKDGIGKIFNAISFGGFNSLMDSINGGNAKATAEKIDKLTNSNEALKVSIDALKNEISGTNGAKSINAYGEARDAQKRYEANLQQILDAQMKYSSSHHSNAYYWNLDKNSLSQVNKLLGTNLSNSWTDFAKLTSDQMNDIRSHLPDIWSEMINQGKYGDRFKDDWNNYADQAGKILELTDNLRESLTQISFDSLRDSFVSSLMDMDKKASDFADDFQEYMTKALLNFSIGDLLDDDLKEWYESWADTMNQQNGKLTDSQIEAYRKQWDSMVEQGIKIRDDITSMTGYTGSSSTSQDSTKGYSTTISEDTGAEISGRLTAVQMTGEEIKQQNIAQSQSLADIKGSIDTTNMNLGNIHNIADETRTILANSYLELQGIRENTGAVIKPIKAMSEKMEKWDRKIMDM